MRIDCDDPRVALWRAFSQAHALLSAALEDALDEAHGLPLVSFEMLAYLADAPDQRLRMQDLTGLLPLTKSGLTRLTDRLEDAGLVCRLSCAADRRGTYASLTSAGRGVLKKAEAVHVRVIEERLVSGLEERHVEVLRGACERVIDSNAGLRA